MANGEITKSNGGQSREPADIFTAMRSEMDRMFERFEHGWPHFTRALPSPFARSILHSGQMIPEIDVHEDSKQLAIEVELPGVDEKDVSVTLANGLLTIKGQKKSEREEKKDNYYMAERSFGSFERSIRMPDTIDENKLEAKFDKGVLKVVAQKRPEAVKAEKKIEISKS